MVRVLWALRGPTAKGLTSTRWSRPAIITMFLRRGAPVSILGKVRAQGLGFRVQGHGVKTVS